jgi:hypothetical protein
MWLQTDLTRSVAARRPPPAAAARRRRRRRLLDSPRWAGVPITITTAKAVDRREAYVRVIFKPESLQQGEADEEPGAKVGCMPLSPPPRLIHVLYFRL